MITQQITYSISMYHNMKIIFSHKLSRSAGCVCDQDDLLLTRRHKNTASDGYADIKQPYCVRDPCDSSRDKHLMLH